MDTSIPDEEREDSAPPLAFNGVLRASGKRFRRQYNPNDWAASILTIRHNVLCLGMSYPSVDKVIANYDGNIQNAQIFHSAPSVERSVELVRRKLLTQIDGRDLARVVALEANNDILAYTVSKEEGAYYDTRHLNADFNSRNLVNQMHRKWGKTVRFRQVILDYFWSPSGSWAMKHWQRSFFNENIPRFVTENLLNFGDLENDSVFVSASTSSFGNNANMNVHIAEDYISSTSAAVYLPFCSHCLSQVVACYDNLSQFYTISFLRKDQLDEHTLWKATKTICPESMSGWLAKTINQEEIYCTLDARQVRHGTGDATVTKEEILDVFHRIDRPDEVRMIKLTALRKFHPDYQRSDLNQMKPTLGLNKGGYVGLRSNRPVVRKEAHDDSSINTMRGLMQLKRSGMPRKRSLSCPQLDKLVNNRKRAKRDLSVPKPSRRPSHPSESLKEKPAALTGIALEWDRFLNSFELDYSNRIKAGNGHCSHKVLTDFPGKTIELVGYDNQSNRSLERPMKGTVSDGKIMEDPNGMAVSKAATTADQVRDDKHNSQQILMKLQASDGRTTNGPNNLATSKTVIAEQAGQIPESNKPLLTLELAKSAEKHLPHSPTAMMEIAKLRRSKSVSFAGLSAKADCSETREAEQSDAANGGLLRRNITTPGKNDVLVGANHHLHPGNVQFFNALSACAHDLSTVAGCFVDALKSLDPPGRFLGKDDSNDTWACIDYSTGMDLAPHLLDSHELSCCSTLSPRNARSSVMLSKVQQFYNAKFKGDDKHNLHCQLTDASSVECDDMQDQSMQGDADANDSTGASISSCTIDSAIADNTIQCSGKLSKSNEKSILSTMENKKSSASSIPVSLTAINKKIGLTPIKANKARDRKIKPSAWALTLAEHENTKETDASTDTERIGTPTKKRQDCAHQDFVDQAKILEDNAILSTIKERKPFAPNMPVTTLKGTKRRSRKGKSTALAMALAEYECNETMDTFDDTEKSAELNRNEDGVHNLITSKNDDKYSPAKENISQPSLPPLAAAADSTMITSTNANNRNQMSIDGFDVPAPVTHSVMTSASGKTADETSFRCLAQWLHPTTEGTRGSLCAVETALRQASEQGKISVYTLLAHALEEEEASLRSILARN